MVKKAFNKLTVVCAWCGTLMSKGLCDEVSHGMCAKCVGDSEGLAVESLHSYSMAELDCLPIGVVRISEQGTILMYNENESKRFGFDPADVIGRNFFADVAPCTAVREFQGRFQELVSAGINDREQLDFVFCTHEWSKLVQVVLLWDAGERVGTLMISTPI